MDSASTSAAPAGIFRRLAALFYDLLLTVALLFIATFAVLPFTSGEAITRQSAGGVAYLYQGWLLAVAFAYFGICWVRGGQTLGMRAWRIRLVAAAGAVPGWRLAVLRFAIGTFLASTALMGIAVLAQSGAGLRAVAGALLVLPAVANFTWMAFGPGRETLQDRACRMRMVRKPA